MAYFTGKVKNIYHSRGVGFITSSSHGDDVRFSLRDEMQFNPSAEHVHEQFTPLPEPSERTVKKGDKIAYRQTRDSRGTSASVWGHVHRASPVHQATSQHRNAYKI